MTMLDTYLPTFDAREYHETFVPADPARTWQALRALDLNRSWIIRTLFALRGLPDRLGRRERAAQPLPTRFVEAALAQGWKILEERPGRELAVGAATQPWAPVVRFQGLTAPEFLTFNQPGYTRIAWMLGVEPCPGGSRAITETRVLATDEDARRRFRRYWFFMQPAISLIRRISLRMLARELRRGSLVAADAGAISPTARNSQ